jgi:hypothetical protein
VTKKLIDERDGVQLFQIVHPADDAEAFVIKDPQRTHETWGAFTRAEADARFEARIVYAREHPAGAAQ